MEEFICHLTGIPARDFAVRPEQLDLFDHDPFGGGAGSPTARLERAVESTANQPKRAA
jgi:hypothetical protein